MSDGIQHDEIQSEPTPDHTPHPDVTIPDGTASTRPRVHPRAGAASSMLPGIAAISVYLLLMAMINAFFAARGRFGVSTAKYGILAVCTLIVLGVFGMLRLRRWGWALLSAGCLVVSAAYFYSFHRTHVAPFLIQGLFMLVFFLYLARTEVRGRLR